MKIEDINSRRLFGDFGPRAPELVPEGLRFVAGVALTLWIPTLALCLVIDAAELRAVMIGEHVLGMLCGLLIYNQSPNPVLSVVPVDKNPNVPVREMKRAA